MISGIQGSTNGKFLKDVTIGKAGYSTGSVKVKGTTSGTVTLSVADAAGTYTLKLPTGVGTSGQFLKTDGVNQASWGTVASIEPLIWAMNNL